MICDTCGGRRVIQGFGGIRKDCGACGATGKVKDKVKAATTVAPNVDKRSREYRDFKKQQEA